MKSLDKKGLNKTLNYHRTYQIVRSRRLQISTVEALYHETKDLYEMDEARDSFLKTFIALTEYQLDQLGLAMRDTFFSV